MKLRTSLQLLSAAGAASLLMLIGCQSTSQPKPQAEKPALLSADQKPKGRAELWSQTCNRCHNARSPDSYNAHEWAVVMTHMRVRGYLTGEEQRAIQEFLQSQ
jgi:nitrate/TMAO reductase-like tetraheme cytochrome c subunit